MQTVVQHESYHANPGPAGQLSCKLWSSRKVIMQTLAQQDSYPATMVQHESYHANPAPEGQLSYKLWSSRTVIMQNLSQQDSYHANCGAT